MNDNAPSGHLTSALFRFFAGPHRLSDPSRAD